MPYLIVSGTKVGPREVVRRMLFWILFAAMTVAATLVVLVPLARHRRAQAASSGHDLAVYRDQLAELERDRERGLIPEAEAAAARAEIARRLLKADAAAGAASAGRSWAAGVALVVAVAVPAVALVVYGRLGSPELPDQPLQARLANPAAGDDVMLMIARVETHLRDNPGDVEGWRVVAPIYARMGRMQDSANAYRRLIGLEGPTPPLLESLGEVLLAGNDGVMTADAQSAFDAAVTADPTLPKARYYRAMGHAQAGRHAEALADYDELIRRSPANAPWLPTVFDDRRTALAALGQPADTPAPQPLPAIATDADGAPVAGPGPNAADVAAAAGMSEADRGAMIDGMVAGLAERLAADPRDGEGWQRLIRAYGVLGRKDDARKAFVTARATFTDDPATLAAITATAAEAGVPVN